MKKLFNEKQVEKVAEYAVFQTLKACYNFALFDGTFEQYCELVRDEIKKNKERRIDK